MRTIKAKFSGGGTLTVTFIAEWPDTWEAQGTPPKVEKPYWTASPGAVHGLARWAAEMEDQTVEIEDDEGPTRETYCLLNGVAPNMPGKEPPQPVGGSWE